jgi:tRNA pseudouridine65 synthase
MVPAPINVVDYLFRFQPARHVLNTEIDKISAMSTDRLDVLYQDDYLIAVNKPSGLLMHPTIIDRHEKRSAMKMLRNQLRKRVFIIHRLDKGTSGVLLFAKSAEAAKKCAGEFQRNEVSKIYLAVVRGHAEARGLIDSALEEIPDKIFDKRTKPGKAPKSAVTEYIKLAQIELPIAISRYPTSRYSLLEVRPKTGRMHQIRRHLRRTHHPVIGDSKHGDHRHNRHFREEWGINRMLLAATELSLFHPYLKTRLRVVAPVDDVFKSILDRFSWLDCLPDSWLKVGS